MENEEFIGINEERALHSLGVANMCYKIAKDMKCKESFCMRMFMIGWNHDVGYRFSKENSEHECIGSSMVGLLGNENDTLSKVKYTIREHGKPDEIGLMMNRTNMELLILNKADLLVDSKGRIVTVEERLNDIKERYGEESKNYKEALEMAYRIKLLERSIEDE